MSEAPSAMVARALSGCKRSERGLFLRELLAHTAAGLVLCEGDEPAAEAVYRLADSIVKRRPA